MYLMPINEYVRIIILYVVEKEIEINYIQQVLLLFPFISQQYRVLCV